MSDQTEARRAVRRSARVMTLRGYERWKAGAFVLVNVAAALELPGEEIRREWARGVTRARHLRALLAEAGND